MTHGSLFSGIGGFELGAKWAGVGTKWNCEYEQYQRSILKQSFPDSESFNDVRTLSFPGYVDIISGGFPCQDISVAGGGIGITGERSGLWVEMFRIIREVRPKYVIIENSPALLIRGFERVLCDLSAIGYNAEWQCLSNLQFGFPHKRERVYVIAYANEIGLQSDVCKNNGFKSVFNIEPPNTDDGYTLSERIYEIAASEYIRNGNGFRHWTHRVGSIGNSVNPVIAQFLFENIKIHSHYIQKNFCIQ